MKYNSFEDMPVWKKAMDLAGKIFTMTDSLPKKEDYGFTSQIRRASLSVSGNLAEGYGRHHTKEKLNFYYDARGSLSETKSHVIYGERVGYFSKEDTERTMDLIEEIWKEMNSLISSLKSGI